MNLENQDLVVTMENVVLQAPRVFLVLLVQLVNLEEMETRDQMVFLVETDLLVARVIVVKMALLVLLALLVTQAHLVLLVPLARVVIEEKLDPLALLDFQVLLVLVVLLVPKVHVVIKVKRVSVVLMASKDIVDSLAIQVPLALLALLVIKVQLAAQDLQAPEDLLDPVVPLEKMGQVDIQAQLGHQGLVVTEVKEDLRALQATQDSLALLDLPVPLVHAVVGGGLFPLVVKKLVVVLPLTTAMNPQ